MSTFTHRIRDIIDDRQHGSSTLVQWIIEALCGEGNQTPSPDQQRWALGALRHIDRSMVVVHHLLDTLDVASDETLIDQLQTYRQQWADVSIRVAGQMLSIRDWNHTQLLLHSHSGMLLSVMERLHQVAPEVRVWQTRSLPGAEGVSQYQALCNLGVSCGLVEDEDIETLVPHLDGAWLGVDQFNPKVFVNKVGSRAIAQAMLKHSKPVYVLGDSRKQVNRISFSESLFETVPFRNGIHLVTESGVYPTVHDRNEFFVTSQNPPS